MKISQVYNNFARGKLDHDLNGRFDLPIYQTGADIFTNFISNFKGNAIYRAGYELVDEFQDCRFIEFKFNEEQSYLCLFYAGSIKFLSYDGSGVLGFVQFGGGDLIVSNPYTLQECKELDFAQNADVMYVVHPQHEPYKLTRTAANNFTFATFTRENDFFADPTLEVSGDTSTTSNSITIDSKTFTVTGGLDYTPNQDITITYDASNFMKGKITSYSGTTLVVKIESIFGSGTYASWTLDMVSNGYPSCVEFYKDRLWYGGLTNKITSIVGSSSGLYDDFTIPDTIDDDDAIFVTFSDIAEQIYWIFGGENSLAVGSRDGVLAVNGGSAGDPITANSIIATLTTAEGSANTKPIKKDGAVFYISKTNRQILYFSYDILTETFKAKDANFVSFDITKGGISNLERKKDRNDIIYTIRGDGNLVTLNLNTDENIIGFHVQETNGTIVDIASITDNDGNAQLFLLVNRYGTYYIEKKSEYLEFALRTDFYTDEESKTEDDEAYHRYVAEQLRECNYLDNSECASDLKDIQITFDGTDTITAASSVFVAGDVGKQIVYRTATGYEKGRFEITAYTSATEVTVDVLITPTANVYSDWYLSFNTISGLTRFIGKTVGVVVDGGYLDDFTIAADTLEFDDQYTSICIGYKYRGLIKSFPLGFQIQAENTQKIPKTISTAHIRTTATAGGLFGTNMYDLEVLQELTPDTLNYLPPIPLDKTKEITYSDSAEIDKCFYIVQDKPLPMTITCVIPDVEYEA